MRRLHQTRSGPVSFSILRLLRPRRCRFRGAAGEVLITASSRAVRRCGTIVVLLTSRRRRRRGPGRLQQPRGSRATPRRGSEAFVATSASSGGRAPRGVHFTPSMRLGTPFLGAGYLAARARAHCSRGTTTSSMRPAPRPARRRDILAVRAAEPLTPWTSRCRHPSRRRGRRPRPRRRRRAMVRAALNASAPAPFNGASADCRFAALLRAT